MNRPWEEEIVYTMEIVEPIEHKVQVERRTRRKHSAKFKGQVVQA